jgi:hypothetical protein
MHASRIGAHRVVHLCDHRGIMPLGIQSLFDHRDDVRTLPALSGEIALPDDVKNQPHGLLNHPPIISPPFHVLYDLPHGSIPGKLWVFLQHREDTCCEVIRDHDRLVARRVLEAC